MGARLAPVVGFVQICCEKFFTSCSRVIAVNEIDKLTVVVLQILAAS